MTKADINSFDRKDERRFSTLILIQTDIVGLIGKTKKSSELTVIKTNITLSLQYIDFGIGQSISKPSPIIPRKAKLRISIVVVSYSVNAVKDRREGFTSPIFFVIS